MTASYDACLKEMYALRRFGIKLGLSKTRSILKNLGDPQGRFSAIHVAGTNGKGSIASCLASILRAAGFRAGLYTSPHLVRFNERMVINGRQISDPDVVRAYEAVRQAARGGDREPTFFEFATAMALFYFGEKDVDWAVIETGMGGRLDATNVIEPELSIISNISLEHREYLGNSIAEIAGEKGGIIKPSVPVLTGAGQKSALAVLKSVAEKKSAPLFKMGTDFRVRKQPDGTFSYYGMDSRLRGLSTPLPGSHQVENAALALAGCEMLNRRGLGLSGEAIRRGVAENRWPGRLEVVLKKPLVILDGAHNLMAARKLGKFMAGNLDPEKTVLIIGVLDDKPYASILKSLLPRCARAVITQAKTGRAIDPEILLKEAKKNLPNVSVIPDVKEAVIRTVKEAGADQAICVAGSLYVVGEARPALTDLAGSLPPSV
ncbi:FolC bifunctional protein [Candidatus Desulfarcum epimagneticum]|uniref:Dihydrofolate synthase/folylpolyglutamate synthase n=1 Tax=uncultured Desulfobacteraceae bacterium TaxID=218296 RepID=A0A484HND1_9BACT|nr:FolC bifunctional protein [uncultured Desulfobacteraceae bacterium]